MESDIDKATEIIEEHNYYPFGLKHRGYNEIVNADREHKFRFNSTEYDDDFDLNWYNMPLRHQDPTTGRWNGIDPVTHFSSSTYASHNNNPVFWADPSGADWTVFKDFLQGLAGRSRDGLVTQGYTGTFGSFAKSIAGKAAKTWAKNKVSGALGKVKVSPIFSRQTGKLLGFDDQGIIGPALIVDEEKFIPGMSHRILIEIGDVEVFIIDSTPLSTTRNVGDNISKIVKQLSSGVNEDVYLPATDIYKNGEKIITMSGKNYVLHDNQWLHIPNSSSQNSVIRNYNSKLVNTENLPSSERSKKQLAGNLMNGGGGASPNIFQLGSQNGSVVKGMENRMAAHDKVVQGTRKRNEITLNAIKRVKQLNKRAGWGQDQ